MSKLGDKVKEIVRETPARAELKERLAHVYSTMRLFRMVSAVVAVLIVAYAFAEFPARDGWLVLGWFVLCGVVGHMSVRRA